MAYKIRTTTRAKNDIFNTVDYLLKKWSESEALDFLKSFEEVKLILNRSPYVFPESEIGKGIHKAVLTKHNTIYYSVDKNKNEINIITVFNVFQNPNKLKL